MQKRNHDKKNPREFWVSYEIYEPTCYAVNDEEEGKPWPSPTTATIHVREVVPGSVTITRQEFRTILKQWAQEIPITMRLEERIFGPEEKKINGE